MNGRSLNEVRVRPQAWQTCTVDHSLKSETNRPDSLKDTGSWEGAARYKEKSNFP